MLPYHVESQGGPERPRGYPLQGVSMGISSGWSSLTPMQVSRVPKEEGVYELANLSRSILYIGRSDDLNRRLQELLNTTDRCWRQAAQFRYELTSQSKQRQRELLEEYSQAHERYPPCN
jgi:hypothetical protein